MKMISGKTKLCAVIGDPVEHSLSPCMHNAAFDQLNLDYAYVAFHVKDIQKAVQGVLGFNLRGLSVTIPHKVDIMQYLDEISPLAQKIGAVNTVIHQEGKLTGTNTDAHGALASIEELETSDGKAISILGVGGAARAVVFALACERRPKRIDLLYRKEDALMATTLLQSLQPHTEVPIALHSMDNPILRSILPETDILINTTPVGMHPHEEACLVDEELFSPHQVVFDIIYNPAKTLFLRRAEKCGARIVNGIPMFVHQGAEQFRLWTGIDAPKDVMEAAVKKALGVS